MRMDYPSDFDTPGFPAGSRIVISRFMGIASCVLFVVIIFACILLLWAVRSQRIDPFIVSIDKLTGAWTVVGHSHGNAPRQYSAVNLMQQSVVVNFAANWFSISDDAMINDALWQSCDRIDDCGVKSNLKYGEKKCALYCATGEELFNNFIYDIVPKYQTRFISGEKWVVDVTQIDIEPAGVIGNNGGTWRVYATIQSNISGDIDVVAFAKVAKNTEKYPKTLGFYVADFNAYKID